MHPLVYVMLIAGGTLAHYRGGYRNFFERDEPENEADGSIEIVECPVCEKSSSWLSSNEECPIVKNGKSYKICKYGTYTNRACGNRIDCYRGPSDRCTQKMTLDPYDQRCAHGYYCNPTMGICTGGGATVDGNALWFVNPNRRYRLSETRPAADDLREPIRKRREV